MERCQKQPCGKMFTPAGALQCTCTNKMPKVRSRDICLTFNTSLYLFFSLLKQVIAGGKKKSAAVPGREKKNVSFIESECPCKSTSEHYYNNFLCRYFMFGPVFCYRNIQGAKKKKAHGYIVAFYHACYNALRCKYSANLIKNSTCWNLCAAPQGVFFF